MTAVLEQKPLISPDQLPTEQSGAIPAIGRVGLSGVVVSAGHFYRADEQFIGRTPEGEHRIIIGSGSQEGRTKKEVVGAGKDVELALHDSLERMRTLETVHTRSLAHIEMTDTAFASFTTLEHYNPKVAPSRSANVRRQGFKKLQRTPTQGSQRRANDAGEFVREQPSHQT